MRSKILNILRALENEDGFHSKYHKTIEDEHGRELGYSVQDYFDFPNYTYVIQRFNEEHPQERKSGLLEATSGNGIKAELRRMELDGLVLVGEQKGVRQAQADTNEGPDYENVEVKSDSLILTTKGKSVSRYFWYKMYENPVSTALSIVATIISVIALFK